LIGIVSYLLINFWFTRIQANKAAILALTMNRVGDMGLSIGFFAMFALFGSLNYSTVFSIAPFMNETAITLIALLLLSGAMAKSSQIPLHSWLPGSMEGWHHKFKVIFIIIFILTIYYLNNKLDLQFNSNNIQNLILPAIISDLPKETLHIITGNMLGDGSITRKLSNKGKIIGNAKFGMTLDVYSLNYITHLYKKVYEQFSSSGLYPYPNVKLEKHLGKTVSQYSFTTKSLPLFTTLHNIWYSWDGNKNKFIKIIPSNISEMFSEISLAYWIMDDGYFDSHGRTQTILLCTESFTKTECILLQSV
jgi:hypothetical protein